MSGRWRPTRNRTSQRSIWHQYWTVFCPTDGAAPFSKIRCEPESCCEVLERDPNDARAHIGLGILRRVQNRLDDARIDLETGITLDPNHTVAVRNLGLTLIQM